MPTYTPLQSIELTAATSSVTFSGIPQIYQDLVIVVNAGNSGGTGYGLSLQLNGDTASNYSFTHVYGTGSSAVSPRSSNTTFILGGFTPSSIGGSTCLINVMNYSNTTTNKTVLSRGSEADYRVSAIVGLWRSTSAVTSIRLLDEGANNFLAGSTFDLYGISPVAADTAQAFGGTDVFYDSTHVYHVFKGSGTFTPYRNLTADVLVVAGGGSGGGCAGGGGGAGGLRGGSSLSLSSGNNYTITVGAGGSPSSSSGTDGFKGSNSSISGSGITTITSTGGGLGGSRNTNYPTGSLGGNGGSGGGGAGNETGSRTAGSGNEGSYSPVEGYGGGAGQGPAHLHCGGGGGGASAAGTAGSGSSFNQVGGNGGAGSSAYSSWGLATGTGQLVSSTYYYAGGGGGGGNVTLGSGGNGGGGNGGRDTGSTAPVAGTMNTGGGGGGVASNILAASGAGGSGIVIVRYAR